ncbi:MAG: hypothetical protein ACKOYL_13630 [Actinomycetota bacterium]
MTGGAMKRHWDSAKELVGTEPPTADDVPITLDGERLDSPEKVREFIDTLNANRCE